eukprot:2328530-Rhodomonas_salina.1
MSGTEIAYAEACLEIFGPEIAYAEVLRSRMAYGAAGGGAAQLAYARAMRCPVLRYSVWAQAGSGQGGAGEVDRCYAQVRAPYDKSGTHIRHVRSAHSYPMSNTHMRIALTYCVHRAYGRGTRCAELNGGACAASSRGGRGPASSLPRSSSRYSHEYCQSYHQSVVLRLGMVGASAGMTRVSAVLASKPERG